MRQLGYHRPPRWKVKPPYQELIDFVEKLKTIHLEEHDIMVSYDATALFTSVPIPKAVEVVKSKLEMEPTLQDRTCLSVDQLLNVWHFV